EEIFALSDAITVFKDGRYVCTFDDMPSVSHDALVQAMDKDHPHRHLLLQNGNELQNLRLDGDIQRRGWLIVTGISTGAVGAGLPCRMS
ncbi:hypothetical protein FK513_32790, partial [Klebsiella pneumoniae]|nr:hypothetical protein [Klebsiella pneumoniae]